MVVMDKRAPSFFEKLAVKAKAEPFVPIGALATVGFLVSGIYSFKNGNKILSQKLMRGRVAAQGFTILVMTAGLYLAGPPELNRQTPQSKLDATMSQPNRWTDADPARSRSTPFPESAIPEGARK